MARDEPRSAGQSSCHPATAYALVVDELEQLRRRGHERRQLHDHMGAAARRETTEPVGERPRPAEPKVRSYKGRFELARPAARQLRLAALEHDISITRLLEAAALVMLDDPAVLERVRRVADRPAPGRG